MKLQTLRQFVDQVGILNATIALNKVDATIRSRLKSGKNWHVVDVSEKPKTKILRCAMIDDVE